MHEFHSGGAVAALVIDILSRRHTDLGANGATIVLLGTREATGTLTHWHGQWGHGLSLERIHEIVIEDKPLALTPSDMQIGQATQLAPALATIGNDYALVPIPSAANETGTLLLWLTNDGPPSTTTLTVLAEMARDIGHVLAGAEAAIGERHESDQLTLLMRYAANPIVLSDGITIISMNQPAMRLFDVAPLQASHEPIEHINAVARNLARLQQFLSEGQGDTGAMHSGELLLEDAVAQEEIVMAIAASRVPETLGGRSGVVSVLHDMTRTRELEHHRVRQQLFESEKLAATGRLAASIAHEINNPLEAIKNSIYLLVRQTDTGDPNRQFLELAQRETERVSRIIRQMLGVSRPSIALAPVSINEVVQEALQLLGPQLRQSRVMSRIELDDGLPRVRASADQLKQVFLNLFLNAKEAMLYGGELLVQTRLATEHDVEFLAGNHILVRIRDDGAGIPSEVLPRVFEPFFSTKTEQHGTGLGLWVCQDIIQHHGGQIIVRSKIGKGTTFLVALPIMTAEPPQGKGGHHESD